MAVTKYLVKQAKGIKVVLSHGLRVQSIMVKKAGQLAMLGPHQNVE